MKITDKTFLKKVFTLSIPIMIQQFIQAALNLVDTIMIGKLGADEIAAVGIANQVFFIVMMIIFGLNSGISVYISQFFGRNDIKNIRKTMGVSLSFGLIVGVVFCIIAIVLPKQIMSLFTSNQNVIELGIEYLKIIGISYVFTAFSLSFHVASRSIGKTMVPMLVSAVALSINTVLNYGLIFGNFGMMELGVRGAAIATVIARGIEFILMIIIIYGSKSLLAATISDLTSYSMKFVSQIFEKAGPVLINELFWSLGTVVYMWSIGQINSDAVASYQIAGSIFRFYEVIFIGFASAAGVLIGNSIGAGDESYAKLAARHITKLSFIFSVFMSILLYIVSPFVLKNYNVPVEVLHSAQLIFNVYCIYGIARMFNLMMIVGVLRGGGDTKYAMVLEMSTVWLVGVPLAVLGAVVLKYSVVIVVAMLLIEEVVKTIIGLVRLRSDKWLHNIIGHIE